jgi:hypothetical protein
MEEAAIVAALKGMERDSLLHTVPVIVQDTPGSALVVTFREKHLTYLKKHPKVDPKNYLANLRTMIKKRS